MADEVGRIAMFYGWVILAALCSIYFLSIGTVFYGFAANMPEMINAMGWTRAEASLGFSILLLVLGLSGLGAAALIRRFGARWTMAAGSSIGTVGAIGCYFMESLLQYYLSIGLVGLGLALLGNVPGMQVLTSWFARKRALAIGIFMSMGGLGAFVAAPVISLLVQTTGNWRDAWLAMMGATMLGGIIAVLAVRDTPEHRGTFIDGVDPSVVSTPSGQAPAPRRVHQTPDSWETRHALASLPFWITVSAAAATVIGGVTFNSQSGYHLRDLGISPITAGSAIGVFGMFAAAGSWLAGYFGDRFDPRYMLATGLAMQSMALVILIYAYTPQIAFTLAAIFGAGNGMALAASPALQVNFYGARNYAALISIHGLVVTGSGTLAPIFAGSMFVMTGTYSPWFVLIAMSGLIPVSLVLRMRPPVASGGVSA
ncbi:MAG: MFS transporter [Acidimicrobiales bacterium]